MKYPRRATTWPVLANTDEVQEARHEALDSGLPRIRLQCRRAWLGSWVGKIPWRRERPPPPASLGFPGGSAGKESARNVEDLGSIPGLERSLEKGKATHSSILAWRIPWTV